MNIREVKISDIQIGKRHRKDLGDLEGLAHSIKSDELFQPIGVRPDNTLIFGLRRLTACRDILGWNSIPARIIDVASIVHGEFVENTFRKVLTISERVALADALRSFSHGGDRRSDQVRNCEVEPLTVDEAAKRAGLGGKDDYYRFKKVEEKGVPELMEAIDAGKVSVSLAAKIAELPTEDQQELLQCEEDGSGELLRTFTKLQNDYTEAAHEPDSEYSTPDWLFQLLDDEFHFTLDAAASSKNAKCPRYFTSEDDGLVQSWEDETAWLNPPFHRKLIGDWVRKAFEESQRGAIIVMLIPSMFKDYRWWKDFCVQGEVRFLHEYVCFHRSDDASKTAYKDVTVVIFGPEVVPGTVAPLRPLEGTADHRKRAEERDPHDFYPTPRGVTEALLQVEQFSESVWEPACGDGAISNVVTEAGYSVVSSDLIDRGYGKVEDFLTNERRAESIITNPPFAKAEEFVRKALSCTTGKVAMFLPLTFLESQKRESLLADSCLKTVYVFVDRVSLYKGGSDRCGGGRAAYAWFVWEHGYDGPSTLGWVHSERKGVILGPLPDCDGTAPITLDLSAIRQPHSQEQERSRKPEFTSTEVGNVQVWCGDSLSQIQNRIAPKSVEVVMTSPPYNTGMKYGVYDDNQPVGEYLDWLDNMFAAIKLVLKDEGSFFLNIGSKPTDPKRARLVTEIAERHFVVQNDIKWIKAISVGESSFGHFTPLNSERYLNHNWEHVLHLTKTGDVPIDRLAVGVPYMDKHNIIRSRSKNTRRCRGDVWFIPHKTVQSQRDRWDHPCPFPVTLAEWCIRLHGRRDDMAVLDPFNGVGSSTVAMSRAGVRGIGIDIDPAYCKAAVNRLEDELVNELIICIEDCYDMRRTPIPATDVVEWAVREKVCDETVTRLLERIPEQVRRLLISDLPPAAEVPLCG